jgi:thioredoxin 1
MMKKIFFVLCIGFLALMMQAAGSSDETQKNSNTQKKEKKNAGGIKVTFIELGSVRCIPCKKMQPIMEEIKKEYKGQVKVVFYDVWTSEGRPYAYKHKIRLIPTQVFLDKDGKEYYRHEGFFPKKELVKVLKQKGVK